MLCWYFIIFYAAVSIKPFVIIYLLISYLLIEYETIEYTEPIIQQHPPWADPDVKREAAILVFNAPDTKYNVDRRSYCGKYKVISGVPRNPRERTGSGLQLGVRAPKLCTAYF